MTGSPPRLLRLGHRSPCAAALSARCPLGPTGWPVLSRLSRANGPVRVVTSGSNPFGLSRTTATRQHAASRRAQGGSIPDQARSITINTTGNTDASGPNPALMSALTTEHDTLQSSRTYTIVEANGRSMLFLSSVSGATVALALVAQLDRMGDTFVTFALTVLPALLALGLTSNSRLADLAVHDVYYARAIGRIRAFYLTIELPAQAVLAGAGRGRRARCDAPSRTAALTMAPPRSHRHRGRCRSGRHHRRVPGCPRLRGHPAGHFGPCRGCDRRRCRRVRGAAGRPGAALAPFRRLA
jgi:hypothetical protein